MIEEFRVDWKLTGKSPRTAEAYVCYLNQFFSTGYSFDLLSVKKWLSETTSISVRRKRGQAIRAFGTWCNKAEVVDLSWICQVPIATERVGPQATASKEDYLRAQKTLKNVRDRLVVELLWSCGLRRTEVAQLLISDVDFAGSYLVVRMSKNGQPRVVPIPASLKVSIRRHLRGGKEGSLLGMTPNAIRLMLQRAMVPSSHAWRRGWAVESLRRGVSETSLRAAAGWSGGAMVVRYTRTLSQELAIAEFQRAWKEG
jgi:integrase